MVGRHDRSAADGRMRGDRGERNGHAEQDRQFASDERLILAREHKGQHRQDAGAEDGQHPLRYATMMRSIEGPPQEPCPGTRTGSGRNSAGKTFCFGGGSADSACQIDAQKGGGRDRRRAQQLLSIPHDVSSILQAALKDSATPFMQ